MYFSSILTTETLTVAQAGICAAASIILGILIAFVYSLQNESSKNFVITVAMLPVLVQIVMMMVNGNLGTGLAVAGAFSLVRFRSVPGSSREILFIFFSMAIGLATGMGYVSFAAVFAIVVCLMTVLLSRAGFGEKNSRTAEKDLRITIPESLNYTDVFDDVLKDYTEKNELWKVKTSNMGSMYELTYKVRLKDDKKEKEMIDALRVRNGNLPIMVSRASVSPRDEL